MKDFVLFPFVRWLTLVSLFEIANCFFYNSLLRSKKDVVRFSEESSFLRGYVSIISFNSFFLSSNAAFFNVTFYNSWRLGIGSKSVLRSHWLIGSSVNFHLLSDILKIKLCFCLNWSNFVCVTLFHIFLLSQLDKTTLIWTFPRTIKYFEQGDLFRQGFMCRLSVHEQILRWNYCLFYLADSRLKILYFLGLLRICSIYIQYFAIIIVFIDNLIFIC